MPQKAKSAVKRVMIVDDNVDAADSLAQLLALDGHRTLSVYAADQVLQSVRSFAPEIVLLDIGLPLTDGYEVARQLRALPGGAAMKLVALTGYGQAGDRDKALSAGFDAHLVKPVDLAALQNLLAGLHRSPA